MNKKIFARSDMIWCTEQFTENEYAEFFEMICYDGERAKIRLSVAGDYTLFVGGRYVASNQFADYPHYKVYDEIDITDLLERGENEITMLVWYFGQLGQRYSTLTPGVIYEITLDGRTVANSNTGTRVTRGGGYHCGEMKKITPQLGYGFRYTGERGTPANAVKMPRPDKFYPRPTKKLETCAPITAHLVSTTENSRIFDLGREYVGLISLEFFSGCEQNIKIAYGEVLDGGRVKRIIGTRDFSVDITAHAGENSYTNYMFRFACRYLEVFAERPLELRKVSLIPQYYPTHDRAVILSSELDAQIYEICLNTLKLCMMEHYVDCPWREQCLYAFDSRNQMLAGYSAFEDGNFEYARANLYLMSRDSRSDGLLSINFPSNAPLTIPSFSLYYILAVWEYTESSGDLTLANEVADKMEAILRVFLDNRRDRLVCKFVGDDKWNFYDWSDGANYKLGTARQEPDLLINAIFIIALDAYKKICESIYRDYVYADIAKEIKAAAKARYYCGERNTFMIDDRSIYPTELANSLAVISGVATGEVAERICDMLASGTLIPSSLSMKGFKYDALISVNKEKYRNAILEEIRETYRKMQDGSTGTVWETAEGASAFSNAGSLCHGWSAIPIYYYDILLGL